MQYFLSLIFVKTLIYKSQTSLQIAFRKDIAIQKPLFKKPYNLIKQNISTKMFKSKQKQQKKPTKANSLALNAIDKYHQKIKSKQFEIYLNSGVNQYDRIDDNYTYTSTVTIDCFDQLLENVVKNFSSLYQIDHKAFQWKDKLHEFIKTAKEILNAVNKLKLQVTKFNEEKTKMHEEKVRIEQLQELNAQLRQQNQQLISKYQHIISPEHQQSLKQKPQYKLKEQQRLNDARHRTEIKQTKPDESIELKQLKEQSKVLNSQIFELRKKCDILQSQNKDLKTYLRNIRNSCFDENQIREMTRKVDLDVKKVQNPHQQSNQIISAHNLSFQKNVLLDSRLSSHIISYLSPKSITKIFSLSRSSRFFLLHCPSVIHSTFGSIVDFKNFQIDYLHRHINYFQKLLKKIPDQIVQSAFYQYNILKEQVGGDFLSILNLCGNIFQGKISPGSNQGNNKIVKQYVESKEIMHHIQLPREEELYLKIDHQLITEFFQQRKVRKQSIMKQIESMGSKISMTESLYSVDQTTLKQFYQTVIKHFTFLFVLSKYLFSQARSLQYLNNFLLSEMNELDKFKIQKEYDLQDIQAELQSANRMNQFLSEKCNKSQQRILRQNGEQLEMQKHINKLVANIKDQLTRITQQEKTIQLKQNQCAKLSQKNNQVKAVYQLSKDKHNRLINELNILKQTILKIQ